MSWSRSIRDFRVKWTRWEFWPAWFFNIPVLFIALYYGLRSGNLLFFTRANPVIETGGLLGESKINIYRHLPADVYPATIFIPAGQRQPDGIRRQLLTARIGWPCIAKPNMGERGFLVHNCANETALLEHLIAHPEIDFLVQDFVTWEEEYSVMYHRFPDAEQGQITSLCAKGFLSVTGDGQRTVRELMTDDPRASFQLDRLSLEQPELLRSRPGAGERVLLEPIGNHCRGTTFLNANDRITPALTSRFDEISHASTGLYYGRFDLKCRSLADLEKGQHFAIMEYNGVGAEPAHIYHPGRSLWKAYRDMAAHWDILYRLCREQKKRGVPAETIRQVWQQIQVWRNQQPLRARE